MQMNDIREMTYNLFANNSFTRVVVCMIMTLILQEGLCKMKAWWLYDAWPDVPSECCDGHMWLQQEYMYACTLVSTHLHLYDTITIRDTYTHGIYSVMRQSAGVSGCIRQCHTL